MINEKYSYFQYLNGLDNARFGSTLLIVGHFYHAKIFAKEKNIHINCFRMSIYLYGTVCVVDMNRKSETICAVCIYVVFGQLRLGPV